MKKLLLLLLFCCSLNSMAQKVRFEYDAAGNQILRKWCTNCPSRLADQNYKDISELEDTDLEKFFPEDVISYYPNPVKEELFLKWDLINDNKVLSIDIYSLNGQLIKKVESNLENNTTLISFNEYPVGLYFVNLNYLNGDQKSIKIVKN